MWRGRACDCSSCRRRAAWTPEERSAFDRADREDETRECGIAKLMFSYGTIRWPPSAMYSYLARLRQAGGIGSAPCPRS